MRYAVIIDPHTPPVLMSFIVNLLQKMPGIDDAQFLVAETWKELGSFLLCDVYRPESDISEPAELFNLAIPTRCVIAIVELNKATQKMGFT